MDAQIVLVGPPGAGKTTIGQLLSQKLAVEFIDTDALVEAEAGKTVSDVFIDDGEEAFRALEVNAVAKALQRTPAVIALGGGAVMTGSIADQLRASMATIVFLDVSLRSVSPRISLYANRPLLLGNPRAQWATLMDERRGVYTALCDHRVDTDETTPDAIVSRILQLLEIDNDNR